MAYINNIVFFLIMHTHSVHYYRYTNEHNEKLKTDNKKNETDTGCIDKICIHYIFLSTVDIMRKFVS